MWKKALTPISVIVLLVGVGLIVYSTFGDDDSNTPTSSSELTMVVESVPTGTVPGETAPGETAAPAVSGAPSGTTLTPAAPSTTAAPSGGSPSSSSIFFPTFPTIVFPSSTLGSPPSSFVLPSIPGFSLAPGVIDALSCTSFQICAQKLYQSWKDGTLGTATLYATQSAVDTLAAFSFGYAIFGPWPGSVTQISPTAFIAKSTAFIINKTIRFNFIAGQTGFKVQSVQIS